MYHYRIKYSGERRKTRFTDTLVISSPYNLNDSYADASFVINQIRYELARKSRNFQIHMIEITEPPGSKDETVVVSTSASDE